jgi:hypothetical protein
MDVSVWRIASLTAMMYSLNATLRTPAEAGPGKAALALSFPGWSDVKVAPVTKELAVGDAPQPR